MRWTGMEDCKTSDPSIGPGAALLIIDMISLMDFEHAEQLAAPAKTAASQIRKLRAAATRAKLPVIYVNDNFGHWGSERSRLIAMCEQAGGAGASLIRALRPRRSDLFIIKPMHSGFYATNLQALLPRLGVSRLILTGMTTELCILFTAADAHMRDYRLWIPTDCVAAATRQAGDFALQLLARHMGVEVRETGELSLAGWLRNKR